MRVLILGGGASGLMAALSAAQDERNTVTVLERQSRVGRKLLATGNGRCNLTNLQLSPARYHGQDPAFAQAALTRFGVQDTLEFFRGLGLLTVAEDSGRVYPLSDQANSVLDVLRFAAEQADVQTVCGFDAQSVRKKARGYQLTAADGTGFFADRLIIACGGCAGKALGGTMAGYDLLGQLGHSRTPLHPSLTQIRTDPAPIRGLKGVRADCHIRLRAGGRTLAVLGNGLDVVYPAENEWLYRDIAASGALISEYPPGTAAEAWHFPARNRIISALSLGTIVVEAPEKSGALITANTALEQGRDVFAVPGPIDAPLSRGCNRLIADGAAALITDSWDVLREYEAMYPHKILGERVELPRTLGYQAREEQARARQTASAAAEEAPSLPSLDLKTNDAGLTDDQITILRALKDGAMQVDDIIETTDLPTRRVLSALTMMELEGYVAQGGGKHFSLQVILEE